VRRDSQKPTIPSSLRQTQENFRDDVRKEPVVIGWNKPAEELYFIYSFGGFLLTCVRPCAKSWRYSDHTTNMISALKELTVSWESQTLLK